MMPPTEQTAVAPEVLAGSRRRKRRPCMFAKRRSSTMPGEANDRMTNDSALERAAPSNLRTDLALGRPPRVAVFRTLVTFGFSARAARVGRGTGVGALHP